MAEINTNPDLDYQWASQSLTVEPNNSANKTEPLSRMKTEGWQWKEKPSFSRLNMWMYRVYTQLVWASDSIDTLATLLDFVVEEDTDYYVSTSGDDDTGDGSSGNPWATPTKAYDYMSSRLVPNAVTVTIYVLSGEYTFTEALNVAHPSGDRIFLVGADLSGNKPQGMQIADYSTDRDNPTIPTQGADEFNNDAGTLGANASAGSRTTARGTDLTANEALIRSRYNTIFKFTNSSGLSNEGGVANINKVAIIGDKTTGTSGVSCGHGDPDEFTNNTQSYGGHITLGSEVAIHGFYWGALANVNSSVLCNYLTVTGCTTAVLSQYGGGMVGWNMDLQGNDQDAVLCGVGGSMTISGTQVSGSAWNGVVNYGSYRANQSGSGQGNASNFGIISSGNGRCGIRNIGGWCETSWTTISGNANAGIVSDRMGNIISQPCDVIGNGQSGVITTGGTISILGADTEIANNGEGALVALGHGSIRANSIQIADGSNDTWTAGAGTNAGTNAEIYAEAQAEITTQAAGSGNIGAGVTFSPAHGTAGNGNSLITYVVYPDFNTTPGT